MKKRPRPRLFAACLALLVLFSGAAVLAGTAVMAEKPLTVLMYHHIVPDGAELSGMTVTVSRFETDLDWLKQAGYTSVLPRELAAGGPLPEKAVLITFDDGYSSNYQYAFPLLQAYGMKAAIAVVTSGPDSQDPNFLTWDMCREMEASGLVEIGSHSHSLHNLELGGQYSPDGPNGIQRLEGESREDFRRRVEEDLALSISRIEAETGAPVTFLAYPFGATEPWAETFIRTHFALTLTTREGRCDPADGLYDLPRLTVSMARSAQDCFSLKRNLSLLIKEFLS